jgi:hypothetical protein
VCSEHLTPPTIIEAFSVNQTTASILAGKAFELAALVLTHATIKIISHPDVQSSRAAGDDLDPILMVHRDNSS